MARVPHWLGWLWQRFLAVPRRLFFVGLVPLFLILAGTLGYYFIEDKYDLFDALYMTVITLSTIGYQEVHPLSPTGRTFTMVLIVGGVFAFFWAGSEVIRAIVSGEVGELLGRQRMQRSLAQMADHLIVCGYGRMGRLVCQEFSQQDMPFVVVESQPEALIGFDIAHGIPLHGDATSDEVLKQAGVERARGLVTVMSSDADNLYTTMSARLLNKKLFIVARVEDPKAEQKLHRAGANRVVSPYQIGGIRLAQAVLRPTVVDFIELATRNEHLELQIEEARISGGSSLAGTTLKDSAVRANLKVIVVAIKKTTGNMIFNPAPETAIEAGDILVAIGDRQHLDALEKIANQPHI
ncbi:MAG TPA: potassium channel protein [Gemmataceae bacterium]|nr:potassium channel protein [Gemmataceae bacterium]